MGKEQCKNIGKNGVRGASEEEGSVGGRNMMWEAGKDNHVVGEGKLEG